jgi:hypothetical protein
MRKHAAANRQGRGSSPAAPSLSPRGPAATAMTASSKRWPEYRRRETRVRSCRRHNPRNRKRGKGTTSPAGDGVVLRRRTTRPVPTIRSTKAIVSAIQQDLYVGSIENPGAQPLASLRSRKPVAVSLCPAIAAHPSREPKVEHPQPHELPRPPRPSRVRPSTARAILRRLSEFKVRIMDPTRTLDASVASTEPTPEVRIQVRRGEAPGADAAADKV